MRAILNISTDVILMPGFSGLKSLFIHSLGAGCVCVCERERERERERGVSACVCVVCERGRECLCVCVCVYARVFVTNEDMNLYNYTGITR